MMTSTESIIKEMISMAQFTTTEVAEKFGTTPRTLRKFLRSDAKAREATTPGKGSRYAIEGKELKGLQGRFNKWTAAQLEEKARRAQEAADAAADSETETD